MLVTHGACGPPAVDGDTVAAGWGVALYAGPEDAVDLSATSLVTIFGPVVCPEAVRRRPPLAAFSLDAIVSNDNTSELSAVTEALLFVAELLGPLRRRAARSSSSPSCSASGSFAPYLWSASSRTAAMPAT